MDCLVEITSPVDYGGGDSPFTVEDPSELVFCCFFRTVEDRAALAAQLKAAAGKPRNGARPESESQDLMSRYTDCFASGDPAGALTATVAWWSGALRHPFHVYNLRMGVGPYRTSFILAFEELDSDDLRFNLARAVDRLESRQQRVLDSFGL